MIILFVWDYVLDSMPHLNALVVKMILGDKEVWRVYVDNEATVSIINKSWFEKMDINQTHLKPCSLLQTFAQNKVIPEEIIILLATLRELSKNKSSPSISVLNTPFPYNIS